MFIEKFCSNTKLLAIIKGTEMRIQKILLKQISKERKSEYKNDFDKIVNGFDLKYNNLLKEKKSISDFLNQKEQFKGLYVFFLNNTAIYVGISKNIRSRIMQHVNGTQPSTSTFAYKIAKIIFEEDEGKAYKGTKKDFFKIRLGLIKKVKEILKKMEVSTIKIDDDDELALFEIYCSMKLETVLNTFETH